MEYLILPTMKFNKEFYDLFLSLVGNVTHNAELLAFIRFYKEQSLLFTVVPNADNYKNFVFGFAKEIE